MGSTMLHVYLLRAKMCSGSLCSLTSVQHVPVELIVNALKHFLNSLLDMGCG